MQARARILGHPIHQMLIPIPVGLIVTGVGLDLVARFVRAEALTVVSFWNLTIGIVAGLIAAVFGILDWTAIPKGTRARRVGALHGLANATMLVLLGLAVAMRADERFFRSSGVAFGLEIAALVLIGVAGWLGGELVDRMGIGVEPDAHPNAPSSLRVRGVRVAKTPRRTLPHGPGEPSGA